MAFPRVNLIYLEHALYFFLSWRLIPGTRQSLVQLTAKVLDKHMLSYHNALRYKSSDWFYAIRVLHWICITVVEMMILLLIVFFDSQG